MAEQDREAVVVVVALAVDAAVVVAGGAGVAVAGIGTAVIEVAEEIVAGNLQEHRIVLLNRESAKGSLFIQRNGLEELSDLLRSASFRTVQNPP